MVIKIQVCKNIEDFQESIVAGMNAQQTLFCLAGIGCGAVAGLIAYNVLHIPIIVCGYISAIAAFPAIISGFSIRDGMNLFQRLKAAKKIRRQAALYPVSTESPEYIEKLIKADKIKTAATDKKQTGGINFEFLWKEKK